MTPTDRRFIAVPFCFSVSEMDVNKGEGMHINPFSHPFHSSKRLRLQWRDQGYKATHNPPNTAKKLYKQANHASTILQTEAYSQNLVLNFLFGLRQASKSIRSCSSKSVIPAAVEQQGIYSWVQRGRRTAFVCRFALKKQFPHLVYFLPPHPPSFSPLYFFNPTPPILVTLLHCSGKQEKHFPPTQYRNAFQHFVSTHISEPNANVLHSLVRLSPISL